MNSRLIRITINSNQPDILVQFYSLLGFEFRQKNIEKGSMVWVGHLQSFEFEIFGIRETFVAKIPSVQLSLEVPNIKDVVEQIRPLGVQIMMEPLETSGSIICYLMDPDGRSIELTQKI